MANFDTVVTDVEFKKVTNDDGTEEMQGFVTFSSLEGGASVTRIMKPGLAKGYEKRLGDNLPAVEIRKVRTMPYKIGNKTVESCTLVIFKGEDLEYAAFAAKVQLWEKPQQVTAPAHNSVEANAALPA